jgi:hypothetical protein
MDIIFHFGDSFIMNIENGVLGKDWFYDFELIELRFLEKNLKCKFITSDNLNWL